MDTKYIPKTPTPQEVFGFLGLYSLTHPGVVFFIASHGATPEASRWKVPPSAPCQTTCWVAVVGVAPFPSKKTWSWKGWVWASETAEVKVDSGIFFAQKKR